MMRIWTNLAWADDPYRTGQQLHPWPSPRLAAFTSVRATIGAELAPAAVALVYLPLHRTRTLTVTGQMLTFGFHAAGTDDTGQVPGLAAIADLGLMQARRHARILAGYLLAADLAALRRAGGAALRGLAAVEHDWAGRSAAPGRAAMFDCGLDLPGGPPLEQACQQAGIVIHGAGPCPIDGQQAAALAVQRALLIALVCARHLGHYAWTGTLPIGQVMADTTWDCLPWTSPGAPGGQDSPAETSGPVSAESRCRP
jgi:hypothetical protein